MSTTWWCSLAVTGLLIGGAACEGDEKGDEQGDDEVVVPSADELADRLIDVDTFDGTWTVSLPDDAPEGAASGVVPVDLRDQLPRIELCEEASDESQAAAQDLRWTTFRQLDLEADDPIRPPDDRTGHLVFVQEFLTSGTPDEIEATFELLRDGMAACLGELPAGEEGPGMAEEMILPDVGDDRYGVLATVEEAGGWAEWRLHAALVRDGAVLAQIVITDIRADTEPLYTIDDVGEMVTTAVGML